jgi:translin
MQELVPIAKKILEYLDEKNHARDTALEQSRSLVRHCALAIRAVHREEGEEAQNQLKQARQLVEGLKQDLATYPQLYHAGYTQDALKEFAEASIVFAVMGDQPLPDPDDLGIPYAAYLGGLGEAAGELRRRALDLLRQADLQGAEHTLAQMDEIYAFLVTVDYPDAITGKLRRITDMVRGVTERTRGDVTSSFQQQSLHRSIEELKGKLDSS